MKRLLLVLLLSVGFLSRPVTAQVIGQDVITAASADCSTAGSCVAFDAGTAPSVAFTISGTFSATLAFEGTTDGVNWNAVQAVNTALGTNGTVATAGSFAVQNSGFLKLRVRASAYVSGFARVVATRGWASARLLSPTFGGLTIGTLTGILRADSGVVSVDAVAATHVLGVAAGYKLARGATAFDGANPTTIATGLATVVSCTATLRFAAALTVTAFVTHDAPSGANVDFYAWVLAGTASTGTETFDWCCVGT